MMTIEQNDKNYAVMAVKENGKHEVNQIACLAHFATEEEAKKYVEFFVDLYNNSLKDRIDYIEAYASRIENPAEFEMEIPAKTTSWKNYYKRRHKYRLRRVSVEDLQKDLAVYLQWVPEAIAPNYHPPQCLPMPPDMFVVRVLNTFVCSSESDYKDIAYQYRSTFNITPDGYSPFVKGRRGKDKRKRTVPKPKVKYKRTRKKSG